MGWLASRRQARADRRAVRMASRLRDAVHDLETWSFGDRPSEYENRKKHIYGLIRRLEAAGGDALAELPPRYDHLASDAMPDVFERVRESWDWETVRKAAAS